MRRILCIYVKFSDHLPHYDSTRRVCYLCPELVHWFAEYSSAYQECHFISHRCRSVTLASSMARYLFVPCLIPTRRLTASKIIALTVAQDWSPL